MIGTWLKRATALAALVSFSAFAGDVVEVGIANYKFDPAEVHIKVGDRVRWVNREKRTSHSVVFTEEGGRESDRMFPDESWERTFVSPGRYPYSCGPHPEMKGIVVVQ